MVDIFQKVYKFTSFLFKIKCHKGVKSTLCYGWVAFALLLKDVQKKSIRLWYYGKEIYISATFIEINFIFVVLS